MIFQPCSPFKEPVSSSSNDRYFTSFSTFCPKLAVFTQRLTSSKAIQSYSFELLPKLVLFHAPNFHHHAERHLIGDLSTGLLKMQQRQPEKTSAQ